MTNVLAVQSNSAGGSNWRSTLAAATSVADLTAALVKHTGGLEPGRVTNIAIVGAGPEGRRLAGICEARDIAISAFVDDDPSKIGMIISRATVEPTRRLGDLDREVPIVIASHRVLDVTQRVRALGFRRVLPFAVFQLLRPDIFKPHMFYDGWFQDLFENRLHYTWLDAELADDRSHQVLDGVIQFRLTGDPTVLAPIIDSGRFHQGLYHPQGLFELTGNEVYVDAGAFDGDSIRWFKERVGDRYERILAFEPDPVTFSRLTKNFAGESRIEAINAGLHRARTVLRFRDDASRGAIFSDEGEASIDVVSLDDVLDGARASYIKMNIEGAEIEALYGARNTIDKWLPKLAISVYHRPSDLWRIPQIVKQLSPAYDLYLRQHDGGVIETVLYALPSLSVTSAD